MLRRIFILFFSIFLFANFENIAEKGLELATFMNLKDVKNFKNSLNEIIDLSADEIKNFNAKTSNLGLDLPKFLENFATDENKKNYLNKIRIMFGEQLKYAADPLKILLKNEINNLSENELNEIMDGKILLSDFIKKYDSNAIREIIFPLIADLSLNENFKRNYKNLTGNSLTSDFNSKFTNEFLSEIFVKAANEEIKFRQNSNATFEALKKLLK